jgi:hypothetical protein
MQINNTMKLILRERNARIRIGLIAVWFLCAVSVTAQNSQPVVDVQLPDTAVDEYFGQVIIDLNNHFSDPDADDTLSFNASIDNERVATVLITDSLLTINEVGLGEATITVTATDNGLPVLDVTDAFVFFVLNVNDPPVVTSPLTDSIVNEGFNALYINLLSIFSDPDPQDSLYFESSTSDSSVVGVQVIDSMLIVNEIDTGDVEIYYAAIDTSGLRSTDTLQLRIHPAYPEGWQVDPTDYENNGQVTAKVVIEGQETDRGYLSAFSDTTCRGVVRATYFESNDHYVFDLICFSNEVDGDTLTFKYYDPRLDSIYDLNERIEFQSEMILGDANNPVILNYCLEFYKELLQGWNWFSINFTQADMSIGALLPGARTEGDYIKNQTSSTTYYDGVGWFGTLSELRPNELYKAYLNAQTPISACGSYIDLDEFAMEMDSGWNYIGYLPLTPQVISEALDALSLSELDYIKSHSQSATYYAASGWFGSLKELVPGEGYMLKLSASDTLKYHEASSFKKNMQYAYVNEGNFSLNPRQFEYSGSVTVRVLLDDMPVTSASAQLLAYSGDELRGISEAMFFEPAQEYLFPMLVYSNQAENDTLTFRYYDPDVQTEYAFDARDALVFSQDMIVANAYDPYDVHFNSEVSVDLAVDEEQSIRIFPNPSNGYFNVQIDVNDATYLRLSLHDLTGRKVMDLGGGKHSRGSCVLNYDVAHLHPGTYFLNVTFNENRVIVRKINIFK